MFTHLLISISEFLFFNRISCGIAVIIAAASFVRRPCNVPVLPEPVLWPFADGVPEWEVRRTLSGFVNTTATVVRNPVLFARGLSGDGTGHTAFALWTIACAVVLGVVAGWILDRRLFFAAHTWPFVIIAPLVAAGMISIAFTPQFATLVVIRRGLSDGPIFWRPLSYFSALTLQFLASLTVIIGLIELRLVVINWQIVHLVSALEPEAALFHPLGNLSGVMLWEIISTQSDVLIYAVFLIGATAVSVALTPFVISRQIAGMPTAESDLKSFKRHRAARRAVLIHLAFQQAASFALAEAVLSIQWLFAVVRLQTFRGSKVVLWLRRFHQTDRGRYRTRRMITTAVRGFGIPMTVQDSSYRWSLEMSATRLLALQPLVLLMVLAPPTGAMLSDANQTVSTLLSVDWLTFCVVFGSGVLRRAGFLPLNAARWRRQLNTIVSDVRGSRGVLSGAAIVRCDDGFWRDAVIEVMSDADAVIIDVTNLTENIRWEIQAAVQYARPGTIVLISRGDAATLAAAAEEVAGAGRRDHIATLLLPDACPTTESFAVCCRMIEESLLNAFAVRDPSYRSRNSSEAEPEQSSDDSPTLA